MRIIGTTIAVAACVAGSAACPTAPAAADTGPEAPAFVPGEVVVGTADGRTRVREIGHRPVEAAAARLRRRPDVRFAEPNWLARAAATPYDQGSRGTPGGWVRDQWNLLGAPGGIRVERAWDHLLAAGAGGGAGATVAVLDTGIAYRSTPEYVASPDFLASQFASGTDVVDDDPDPLDENGHGTFVAGTIGEQVSLSGPAPSPDYETGIAYGAQLMPVRVLGSDGTGASTDVADGIVWAADNGADVINLSLQFDPAVTSCADVPTVCAAVRRATDEGSLVVAAAGNSLGGLGRPRAMFPGAAPGVFAVGATTEHGCLADYSSFRHRTDLLAPGGGSSRAGASRRPCAKDSRPILQLTYSCFPTCGAGYSQFAIRPDAGTSMAAAHASAVAALVIASGVIGANPNPARIAKRLACTARRPKPARFYGDGVLDAARATLRREPCARPR